MSEPELLPVVPTNGQRITWTWTWFLRRVRETFWERDWEMVAVLLSLRSILWGAVVLTGNVQFAATPWNASAFLAIPRPELSFGIPMLLIGLWQFAALFADRQRQLIWSSVSTLLIWSVVSALYARSNLKAMDPYMQAVTAVFALWLCARIWVEDGRKPASG